MQKMQCGLLGRRRKLLPLAASEKILIGMMAGAEPGHYPSGVGKLQGRRRGEGKGRKNKPSAGEQPARCKVQVSGCPASAVTSPPCPPASRWIRLIRPVSTVTLAVSGRSHSEPSHPRRSRQTTPSPESPGPSLREADNC